jgi:hypothetical protein
MNAPCGGTKTDTNPSPTSPSSLEPQKGPTVTTGGSGSVIISTVFKDSLKSTPTSPERPQPSAPTQQPMSTQGQKLTPKFTQQPMPQPQAEAKKALPAIKEGMKKDLIHKRDILHKKLSPDEEATLKRVDEVANKLTPMLEVEEVRKLATKILSQGSETAVLFKNDPNTRGGGAHFDKNSKDITINPDDEADIIADNLIYEMCNAELVAKYKTTGNQFNNGAIDLDGFSDQTAQTEYQASRKYATMMKQAQLQGKPVCEKGLRAIAFFENSDPAYFNRDHLNDPPEPNLLQAFKDSPHSTGSTLTTKDMYLWEKLQKQDAKSLSNAAIQYLQKLPVDQSGAVASVKEEHDRVVKKRQEAYNERTEAIKAWIAQAITGKSVDAKPQIVLDIVAALDPICCAGIQGQFRPSATVIAEAGRKANGAGYNGLGAVPDFTWARWDVQ